MRYLAIIVPIPDEIVCDECGEVTAVDVDSLVVLFDCKNCGEIICVNDISAAVMAEPVEVLH